MPKITIGISIGDLNGIGSEIIFKTFSDSRMLEMCTPVIFASYKTLNYLKRQLKQQNLYLEGIKDLSKVIHGKVNVIDVWKEPVRISLGKQDASIGKYAVKSFAEATKALKEKKIDVLVTAPIHKYNVQNEDFKFAGHTDYLNQELDGDSLMFMISEGLRVGLLTDHVSLDKVTQVIKPELIYRKINVIHKSLIQDFGITKPRIAVLGINPHCGDQGVIGDHDDTVLIPTLQKIQEVGKLIFGPYAADSFFGSQAYKKFDAVIAPYHDQGLIAFKTLSFGNGVNFTAGLSGIRTSPDHGTAFDIAGKNQADHQSFRQAVYAGIDIYKKRAIHLEISANPL